MPKAVITADHVQLARQGLACGDTVREIAERLGVAYNTLWRRLTREGLLGRDESSRHEELVFAARCPICACVIRASERGEGGQGFLRWKALARRHARTRHALTTEHSESWSERLWLRSGRRFVVSIAGTAHERTVQAGS